MQELEAAIGRLTRAVERAAAAAETRLAAGKRLGAELKREEGERVRLEALAGGVGTRLDDAIARLRAALDG
ncbi:MAG TPA: hypothetical protein VKS60_16120 [Stellaceae bacterium]|nr:hypothetical protein [Stellaceae bacterium]